MKIKCTILALAAAGILGGSAYADPAGPFGFAILSNGHGSYIYEYYQAMGPQDTSVALETPSGNVGSALPLAAPRPLPDGGNVRYVIGTNQHGQTNAAYIPVSSNFAQAQQ